MSEKDALKIKWDNAMPANWRVRQNRQHRMVEHVVESQLAEYFRSAFAKLKAGGVFLNHDIGRAGHPAQPGHPTLTDVYVFPDAELIPIATTLRHAEEAGFEVCDVENLREHYFLTLC